MPLSYHVWFISTSSLSLSFSIPSTVMATAPAEASPPLSWKNATISQVSWLPSYNPCSSQPLLSLYFKAFQGSLLPAELSPRHLVPLIIWGPFPTFLVSILSAYTSCTHTKLLQGPWSGTAGPYLLFCWPEMPSHLLSYSYSCFRSQLTYSFSHKYLLTLEAQLMAQLIFWFPLLLHLPYPAITELGRTENWTHWLLKAKQDTVLTPSRGRCGFAESTAKKALHSYRSSQGLKNFLHTVPWYG